MSTPTPPRRPRSGKRRVARTTNLAFIPPPMPPEAGEGVVDAASIATMVEPHVAQISYLAEILAGAAHADGVVAPVETETIARLLGDFVGADLPEPVVEAVEAFRPRRFDLKQTCRHLQVPTHADRMEVLALTMEVIDADEVRTAGEGAYIHRLGHALGVPVDDYADLLAEVAPPPLPTD